MVSVWCATMSSDYIVACPHCGQEIAIPPDYESEIATCPNCAGGFGFERPVQAAAKRPLPTPAVKMKRRPPLKTKRDSSITKGLAGEKERGTHFLSVLLSPDGRMRRSTYWLLSLGAFVFMMASILIFAMIAGYVTKVGEMEIKSDVFGPNGWIYSGILLVLALLAFSWVGITTQIRRWHDRDKSGLWILIGFVPVIGPPWEFIELGFLGPKPRHGVGNAYGTDPRSHRRGPAALIGILALVAMIPAIVWFFAEASWTDSPRESSSFSVAKVAIPEFPELPEFVEGGSGVKVGQFRLSGEGPGQNMQMRIYLPMGEHDPGSLSCVLVAPAGTNLLQGSDIGELNASAYHKEALPYALAGMAVVFYSIDGEHEPGSGSDDMEEMRQMAVAYKKFKQAGAGVVNGRNALEFVLAKMPMVNRDRIYSAGHSSAGTLSLLLAAHEPRLKGCIAYAPAADVEAFQAEFAEIPDIGTFFSRDSPFLKAEFANESCGSARPSSLFVPFRGGWCGGFF